MSKSLTHEEILKEIIDELHFEIYLSTSDEAAGLKGQVQDAIATLILDPMNYRKHIEKAREFLEVLWQKYDCESVVEVFDAFTKVEPVFTGIERQQWYRDHSVHTFHVFVFGLRILSKIIDKYGDTDAKQVLKIDNEEISKFIPSFHDYSYKERIFYLWSLISTFHDIAIPLEHLGIIKEGLNKFSGHFNLSIEGPSLSEHQTHDTIDDYFDNISRIFKSEIKANSGKIGYVQNESSPYLKGILLNEFNKNNHGVLSGYLMYKTVRDTFLLGLSNKHKFTEAETFDLYCSLCSNLAA